MGDKLCNLNWYPSTKSDGQPFFAHRKPTQPCSNERDVKCPATAQAMASIHSMSNDVLKSPLLFYITLFFFYYFFFYFLLLFRHST